MYYNEDPDRPSWREQLPAILTPLEVMDILGIGKNTVYSLLSSGRLKGFRIGRSWRITSDAVEDFLMLK
jgi:excisionase family DNA binding protein